MVATPAAASRDIGADTKPCPEGTGTTIGRCCTAARMDSKVSSIATPNRHTSNTARVSHARQKP